MMKKLLSAAALAAAVAYAPATQAQVAFDLKVGYGIPVGNLFSVADPNVPVSSTSMSNPVTGQVPLGVAVRY